MVIRFRSSVIRVLALAGIVGICLTPAPAVAQDDDQLAGQLIKTSASVEPGDHVVVFGGKHSLDLMEAVAIEAQKAGGMVEMMLNTDRVARSKYRTSTSVRCRNTGSPG